MAQRAFPLPDLKFAAESVPAPAALWNARTLDRHGKCLGNDIRDPVLAGTPLVHLSWSELHAYMYRRFGPPREATDSHKDLCGAWVLTTPQAGVFVRVLPSLCGATASLSPCVQTPSPYGEPRRYLPDGRLLEVASGYRTTLIDLLRPVSVDDALINALGEVEEGWPVAERDEDGCELLYAAEYFRR